MISTKDYIETLTIEQLRFFREEADKKIKEAETKPLKIVWVVSTDSYNDSWHREEDYETAYKSYLKLLDKWALQKMEEFIEDRPGTRYFGIPKLQAHYENEVEYEEWFK